MSNITDNSGIPKSSQPPTAQSLRRSQRLRSAREEAGVLIGKSSSEVATKWISKHAHGKCDKLVKKLTSGASPVCNHTQIDGNDSRRSGFAPEGQKNWPCHNCGTESSIYALYGGEGEDSGLGKAQTFKRRGRVHCDRCKTSTRNVVATIAMLRGDDHEDPEVIDGVIGEIFDSGVIDTPPPLADDIDWDKLGIDPDDETDYRYRYNLAACERELESKQNLKVPNAVAVPEHQTSAQSVAHKFMKPRGKTIVKRRPTKTTLTRLLHGGSCHRYTWIF